MRWQIKLTTRGISIKRKGKIGVLRFDVNTGKMKEKTGKWEKEEIEIAKELVRRQIEKIRKKRRLRVADTRRGIAIKRMGIPGTIRFDKYTLKVREKTGKWDREEIKMMRKIAERYSKKWGYII